LSSKAEGDWPVQSRVGMMRKGGVMSWLRYVVEVPWRHWWDRCSDHLSEIESN